MRAKNLGRNELLAWVNSTVQSDYAKIENLSDGIAFCQLIDAFYSNSVDLSKLKCREYYSLRQFEIARRLGKKFSAIE